MISTFQSLADSNRLAIVQLLLDRGEQPVGALVEHLPIAQSGVSRHLRLLREAGIVQVRSHGQQRLYSLRAAPFQELATWLVDYRELWEARMDALEVALAARQPDPTSGESP